jgi:hypothetical protein
VLYVTGRIDKLMDARALWEGEAFLKTRSTLPACKKRFRSCSLRHASRENVHRVTPVYFCAKEAHRFG